MEPTTPFDLTLAIDGWLKQCSQKNRWAAPRWAALCWATPRFRPDDLEELCSHLLDQTDDLIAGGKSPEQAFRLAISQLGEPECLAKEYRKVHYWYVVWQKAWAISQLMVTSRRVVAFSVVFVAITFGSIFGQKPSHKRARAQTVTRVPQADTTPKALSSKQHLFK